MSEITEMESQGLEFSQGTNPSKFTEIGPQKDGGEEFYHRGNKRLCDAIHANVDQEKQPIRIKVNQTRSTNTATTYNKRGNCMSPPWYDVRRK